MTSAAWLAAVLVAFAAGIVAGWTLTARSRREAEARWRSFAWRVVASWQDAMRERIG